MLSILVCRIFIFTGSGVGNPPNPLIRRHESICSVERKMLQLELVR
jgi:hypothetical protein